MAAEKATAKKETETTEKAAEKATAKKPPVYVIEVKNNPDFCGIGAGGVQFANGTARTESARMAAWFAEHPGYTVTKE